MADSSFRVKKSLNIEPKAAPTLNEQGDVGYDTADDKLKVRGSSTTDSVVTEAKSQPLTNKTIDADQNTITNIENADIKAGAAIEYSKLNLSNSIVNADVATGAAIAVDKLAALTASKALQSNASGVIEASTVTNTELGYVSGVTSAIQTQLNNKQATGNYLTDLTGDVTASGPGSAAATIANDAVTTVKILNDAVTTAKILNANVTNAKLADVATATIKGRTTAGTGAPEDLTATQATAILNNMVGDSGSGGTKGLVPAPAAGDAAASKFLKADGTWATAGAAITVKDEGSNVDTAVTTLNFTGSGVTATQTSPGIVEVSISGGGGGGGTGGADDNYLLDQLDQDELDIITAESVNAIRDDFGDSEKGTKTNTVQALSTLALSTGQNSGSYERIRETSTVVGAARGIARLQVQALAPDNSGLSANVFTFSGDVSSYFSAGNTKVLICKKITSDGTTVHVFLRETEDKIARLTASAVSYNSGTNKTSVTISNGGALDLDLDLTGSEYAEKLRVIPMTHDFQVKSRAASSYETADIADAHGSTTVSIPGQAAFLEAINFTGTVIHHDVKFSPNGTYAIARIIERVSGGDQWRFYGSSTKGITWTLLGNRTAYTGGNFNEEISMEGMYRTHSQQTLIADNGKWISAYDLYNGANHDIKAVYGNLGLSDINNVPTEPLVTGSDDICWKVTGDTTDLSLVGMLTQQAGAEFHLAFYSNGGATFLYQRAAVTSTTGVTRGDAIMTGSAGSRRFYWIWYHDAGSAMYLRMRHETDNFVTNQIDYNIGNRGACDLLLHNNKLVVINMDGSTVYWRYMSNATTGTPSAISSELTLAPSGLSFDKYLGSPNNGGTGDSNLRRHMNNRGILDTDRLVYALDYVHGDGVRRTHVHEVRDITSYQGSNITQNNRDSWAPLKTTDVNTTRFGQTITATSGRVRTFRIRAYQNGVIPAGHTLTCEIQEAPSGGIPNGVVVATAINSYDPRNITRSSSGQDLFFTFNSPTLVFAPTTQYTFVLNASYPASVTNHLYIGVQSGSPYAGGTQVKFNGTIWAQEAGNDFTFNVYGEWIYDLSHETRNELQEYGRQVWNQEATLAAVDSSTLRMAHRRTLTDSDIQRAKTGHVWSSLFTLGTSGVASTYTAPTQIGYQSNAYDKNLVLAISPGISGSARIDRTTGAVDTNNMAETRDGLSGSNVNYTNVDSTDYVSDSSFQSGIAMDLNGTDERLYIDANNDQNFNSAYPFCIEAEFKTTTTASIQCIVTKYAPGSGAGWDLAVNRYGTGKIVFDLYNSGNTLVGSARSLDNVISANTTYVVRVTYAGDGSAPKIFLSSSWNGTFTEVSYTSQLGFTGSTASSTQVRIGNIVEGSETRYFSGRIGYVKIANGASSFAYQGYKNQKAIVGLINTGTKVFAETKGGNMSNADMNSSYDEFGMIDPNGSSNAVVDSNDIYLMFDHTIAGTKGQVNYLKVNMARASGTDVGAIKGLNFKFSK